MRGSFVSLLVILACSGLVACNERRSALATDPGSPPLPSAAIEAAPAPAEATPAPGTCTDHSSLDPKTLPPLPPSRWTATFEQIWARVLEKYYDPTIGCLDWPALRLRYGTELAGADNRQQAYAIMRRLLDELDQSHFSLVLPGEGVVEEERQGPAAPLLEVRWVEDQAVVTRSRAKGPQGKVAVGARLLAVGDHRIDAVADRVRARTRPGSDFAFHLARAIEVLLSGRPTQSKRLHLEDLGKDREFVRWVPCELPEGELVTLGNLRDVPTRIEARLHPGTKVGILGFNVWMLPMVQRVETELARLREDGMKALVIDLRGNPGGVGLMAVPVARLLLAESASLGTMRFRDFQQDFAVQAEDGAFAGEVAILVDERTASTSEIFAAGMRDLGRARVFGGRASAGAALPSLIEELPEGALLQYVVGEYRSPKGARIEGQGVVPDTIVAETRAAFASGHDPVLEAAVAALQSPP